MIHSFGRAELVDRAALARLVSSISRFLTPEEAAAAVSGSDIEVLDSRPMGGAWVLDQLWERLGIGQAVRRTAAGRKLDPVQVERVCCLYCVAQRALKPASKLAATEWVAHQVTGTPSRVTAIAITTCGRSLRKSLECPNRRAPALTAILAIPLRC